MEVRQHPELQGLAIAENFISEEEHDALIEWLEKRRWRIEGMRLGSAVQSFGWVYEPGTREIRRERLEPHLPAPLERLARRMTRHEAPWFDTAPNQATAHAYRRTMLPILPMHTDHNALGPKLASLSLVEQWRMVFIHYRRAKKRVNVELPPRSLLLQSGSARYEWRHGITSIPQTPPGVGRNERRRVSVTFRRVQSEWIR